MSNKSKVVFKSFASLANAFKPESNSRLNWILFLEKKGIDHKLFKSFPFNTQAELKLEFAKQ